MKEHPVVIEATQKSPLIYDSSKPLRMPKAFEEAQAKANRQLNNMAAKEANIAKINKQSQKYHAQQDINQV